MPDYALYCGDCGAPLAAKAAEPRQANAYSEPSRGNVYDERQRGNAYNEVAAVDAAEIYEGAYAPVENGAIVKTDANRKKILEYVCYGLLGMAALFGFVFAFLIGVKAEISGIGSTVDIYHYFGDAYDEISETIGTSKLTDVRLTTIYFPAVAGTVVAALSIILAVVFGSLTVAAAVKKFVYKKDANFVKPAIWAYLSFALCATAFLAVHATEATSAGVTVSAEFSDATLAGLIVGGIMLGAYYVCRLAVRLVDLYKNKGDVTSVIAALAAGVLLVAVIAVLALPSIKISSDDGSASLGYPALLSSINWSGRVTIAIRKSIACSVIGFAVQLIMITVALNALVSLLGYATEGKTVNPLGYAIATVVLSGVNVAMAAVSGDSYIEATAAQTKVELSCNYGAPIALVVLSVLLLVAAITFKVFYEKASAKAESIKRI